MRPLNIVFLHAHNTGRYIEPYGHAVPTPNLMRLAQQGVTFRQAYTCGPSCSPSRGCLMTGMYPHVNGLIGLAHRGFRVRDYSKTLIRLLNDARYLTVLAGLQHITTDKSELGYGLDISREKNSAAAVTPGVLSFLANPPRQPFFLDVGINETHRGYPDPGPEDDPRFVRPPAVIPDTPHTRLDFAGLRASARVMDDCFGQILAALDAQGLADHTLVLCLDDHGLQWPLHMANCTDRGLETFFILRGPKGSPFVGGKVSDALVTHLDVLPTFCDAAGAPTPTWAQGKSLWPLLRGEVDHLHEEIFGEQTFHAAYDPQRTVRTTRYRYLRYFGDRRRILMPNVDRGPTRDELFERGLADLPRPTEALYDLVFDPQEMCDVVNDPRYAHVADDLRGRLERWMRHTDDPLLRGDVPPPTGSQVNDPDGLHPMDNIQRF